MITAEDLLIGADAFRESGAQIHDGVTYVDAWSDPFYVWPEGAGHDWLDFQPRLVDRGPPWRARQIRGLMRIAMQHGLGEVPGDALAWLMRTEAWDDMEISAMDHVVHVSTFHVSEVWPELGDRVSADTV